MTVGGVLQCHLLYHGDVKPCSINQSIIYSCLVMYVLCMWFLCMRTY